MTAISKKLYEFNTVSRLPCPTGGNGKGFALCFSIFYTPVPLIVLKQFIYRSMLKTPRTTAVILIGILVAAVSSIDWNSNR
jgi:hypothetical protein